MKHIAHLFFQVNLYFLLTTFSKDQGSIEIKRILQRIDAPKTKQQGDQKLLLEILNSYRLDILFIGFTHDHSNPIGTSLSIECLYTKGGNDNEDAMKHLEPLKTIILDLFTVYYYYAKRVYFNSTKGSNDAIFAEICRKTIIYLKEYYNFLSFYLDEMKRMYNNEEVDTIQPTQFLEIWEGLNLSNENLDRFDPKSIYSSNANDLPNELVKVKETVENIFAVCFSNKIQLSFFKRVAMRVSSIFISKRQNAIMTSGFEKFDLCLIAKQKLMMLIAKKITHEKQANLGELQDEIVSIKKVLTHLCKVVHVIKFIESI